MISFNYYNLWNKNVSLTFPLLSMLVACTDEKDDYARIHPNLLPSEGHTYSLQAVGKDITFDLLEESNITNVAQLQMKHLTSRRMCNIQNLIKERTCIHRV
jgi:hypothetical protein